MPFWTYLQRCSDGRFYTGHTDDLERRIAQHRTGGFCDFTSRRRPVSLVWCEHFQTRLEALEAERRVGGWSRAKKEALIAGDWRTISHFARPPRERFSTSLETNGVGESDPTQGARKRGQVDGVEDAAPTRNPFVSSEVEKRNPGPSTCR